MDDKVFIRQKVFDKFRPFDQATLSRIYILLKSDIQDLLNILCAEEIKLIKPVTVVREVFIDNGIGWAVYLVGGTDDPCNFLYQGGFTGAHFSFQQPDPVLTAKIVNPLRRFRQIFNSFADDLQFLIGYPISNLGKLLELSSLPSIILRAGRCPCNNSRNN